jgi:hypothetical protein
VVEVVDASRDEAAQHVPVRLTGGTVRLHGGVVEADAVRAAADVRAGHTPERNVYGVRA